MKIVFALIAFPIFAQYKVIYPLSVVPGGIDASTVNEHIKNAEEFYHRASLRHGRYYVQFTQNGITGWSSEAKDILQGTECFVNRHGIIKRSRCGNGLSKTKRLPHLTAPLPPDAALETPRIVDVTPPDVVPPHLPLIAHLLPPDLPVYISHPEFPPAFPPITPPITIRPNSPAPYLIPPAVGIPVGYIPVPPVAAAVPEPRYGWALLGLLIFAFVFWLVKSTKSKDEDKND